MTVEHSYDPADGFPRIMPSLRYEDIAAALAWLSDVFDVAEHPDSGKILTLTRPDPSGIKAFAPSKASRCGGRSRLCRKETERRWTMKIFLAGATGALGRQLLPRQVERGHEVTGMSRSESKQQLVRDLGGRPVVGDALDPESVAQAVAAAEPEAIVHQLTAIPHALDHRAAGPAHVAAPLGDRERHPHRADRRPPPRRPRRSYEDFQERTSSPLRRREVAGPDVVVIVDFGDGWRVQALAAALRCRRRHLCARFGEEIGVPPNSHARLGQAATARDERRAAAEALLADTTAAELTGFISTADALLGRLAEVIGGAGDPRGAP